MSLRSQPLPPVPEDTTRIAQAAFRRGNPYMLLRDQLGALFADADFADLYPKLGQPAYAPWRLALVTLMQFREGLSDRRAADAVRGRIDWKYLLALDLADAGFDFSVLCEFRARLLEHEAGERSAAHGQHARLGCHPHAEPARTACRDAEGGLECRGQRGAGLAWVYRSGGLARALRPKGRGCRPSRTGAQTRCPHRSGRRGRLPPARCTGQT
jgi:transposase